jgi:alcohol dehydrogenase class IV
VTCRHLAAIDAGLGTAQAFETGFTIDASRVTFGPGTLAEVGARARALGITRAALITDRTIRALPWFDEVERSLRAASVNPIVYDEVAIEPTEASWDDAIHFAREAKADGFVSLGGGSVIDTAKVANLYTAHPAAFATYINAPLGEGQPVPGPLAPHIACPTTAGTGSEVTGIAIFDWHAHRAKTGISSPRLRPSEAIVDPRCTYTLPAGVVASSGMDVLCHALESFTARPFSTRGAPATPLARPSSQGRNPWSDIGCREALRICGAHLADAVTGDRFSRDQMMWAATLAGIAFGNAGVHVPHAMAYAVAGQVKTFRATGYPDAPLVPHGVAVAVNAPAVFRATAPTAQARHFEAAQLLGADTLDRTHDDGGELLAQRFIALMKAVSMPNGLVGVGYERGDITNLVEGALPQQRLLQNSPLAIDAGVLATMFERALEYW